MIYYDSPYYIIKDVRARGLDEAVDFYCRDVLGINPACYAKGSGHAFGPDIPEAQLEPYLLEPNGVKETRAISPWATDTGEGSRYPDGRPWPEFNCATYLLRNPRTGAPAGRVSVVAQWGGGKPDLLVFSEAPARITEEVGRIFAGWTP